MAIIFKAGSAGEAWDKSIAGMLSHGKLVPTEKGISAIELTNVTLEIKNVEKEPRISPNFLFSEDFVEAWAKEFHHEKGPHAIRSRIFEFGEQRINQFEAAVDRLKENWHSRRALVCTWDTTEDRFSEHPPCPLIVQLFIRDEKLHASVLVRSNDAWKGAPVDIRCLSDLQRKAASELQIQCGTYTHFAISYHIYEPDIAIAHEQFSRS